MLMVIFGAGASYDSNPSWHPGGTNDHAARLPLANGLFSIRFADERRQFERMLPIVPFLETTPSGMTIEQRLEELQADAERDPERHRQLAAVRFYLHSMIWGCEQRWLDELRGVSNYKTLLDEIRS